MCLGVIYWFNPSISWPLPLPSGPLAHHPQAGAGKDGEEISNVEASFGSPRHCALWCKPGTAFACPLVHGIA